MRLLLSLPVALVLGWSATAPALAAEFDRVCETHAEGADPDDVALPDSRRDIVAGRVSIVGGNRLSGRRRRSRLDSEDAGGHPSRRARRHPRSRRSRRLDSNRSWDGQSSVRFHACPPDTKRFSDGKPFGEWTGYPGGLIVERRRCVTLEFLEAGKPTVRRRVGIGRRCR